MLYIPILFYLPQPPLPPACVHCLHPTHLHFGPLSRTLHHLLTHLTHTHATWGWMICCLFFFALGGWVGTGWRAGMKTWPAYQPACHHPLLTLVSAAFVWLPTHYALGCTLPTLLGCIKRLHFTRFLYATPRVSTPPPTTFPVASTYIWSFSSPAFFSFPTRTTHALLPHLYIPLFFLPVVEHTCRALHTPRSRLLRQLYGL